MSSMLELSFDSIGIVQLPIALYSPKNVILMTRASEPSKGRIILRYAIRDPLRCPSEKGDWKLIIHKRILDEQLDLHIRFMAEPAGTFPEDNKTQCTEMDFSFASSIPDGSAGWYCGELHLHSDMSTGRTDVATIMRVAREQHLDYIAITDHFTPSHWERIEELGVEGHRPLFLRSLEIAGDRGHANLHGVTLWPDPFPDDSDGTLAAFLGKNIVGSMEQAADLVHSQGGIFSINHPLSAGAAWRYDEFPLEKADLIEVACLPDGPVSFLYTTFWDRFLCMGLHITGVGSSDSHDPLQDGPWALGKIRNWVYASSLSREGILEGLKKGVCYVAIGDSKAAFFAHTSADGGMDWPMGSTAQVKKGDICKMTVELYDHPSGNLFVMKDGFLYDVRYVPKGIGPDIVDYCFDTAALGAKGCSYIRFEFHEDLEKAKYYGMAFRDHRSLRLLSNPIWLEVVS